MEIPVVNLHSTSMPLDMPSNPSEFSKSERETALLVSLKIAALFMFSFSYQKENYKMINLLQSVATHLATTILVKIVAGCGERITFFHHA